MSLILGKELQRARQVMGNPLRHFWVSAFKNDVGRPILANSFPKSGTFLLSRCLDLLPDVEPFHKGVYLANRPPMRPSDRYPQLARMPGGSYVSGHLPYSAESAEILSELGFRQILILRDPRDIAVSYYKFEMTYRWLPKHDYFKSLPNDTERLTATIIGDGAGYNGMIKNMRNYIPWLSDDCLLIRFEDLVGAKGGGSGQKQSETVRKLVEHLEIDLSEDKLNQIAGDVHNANSRTFRKGVIGGWRDEFTAEQSQWFKEKFNDLLVTLGYEEDDAW